MPNLCLQIFLNSSDEKDILLCEYYLYQNSLLAKDLYPTEYLHSA